MSNTLPKYVASFFAEKGQDLKVHKTYAFELDEEVYTIPYTKIGDYKDGGQWGEASLTIKPMDGGYIANLSAKFKNKRKLDGDHFRAIAAFVDADGKPINKIVVTRGLDAMCKKIYKCETKTGGRSKAIKIENFDGVVGVILALGYKDTVDDAEFWKKAEKFAKEVKEFFEGDEGEEEAEREMAKNDENA